MWGVSCGVWGVGFGVLGVGFSLGLGLRVRVKGLRALELQGS